MKQYDISAYPGWVRRVIEEGPDNAQEFGCLVIVMFLLLLGWLGYMVFTCT